jgi:hypothetical protein
MLDPRLYRFNSYITSLHSHICQPLTHITIKMICVLSSHSKNPALLQLFLHQPRC